MISTFTSLSGALLHYDLLAPSVHNKSYKSKICYRSTARRSPCGLRPIGVSPMAPLPFLLDLAPMPRRGKEHRSSKDAYTFGVRPLQIKDLLQAKHLCLLELLARWAITCYPLKKSTISKGYARKEAQLVAHFGVCIFVTRAML